MIHVNILVSDDNSDLHPLGVFDLDALPRNGETVWYEREREDGARPYIVKYVNYFIQRTSSVEIWVEPLLEGGQPWR